jgi:hypothetical protein
MDKAQNYGSPVPHCQNNMLGWLFPLFDRKKYRTGEKCRGYYVVVNEIAHK